MIYKMDKTMENYVINNQITHFGTISFIFHTIYVWSIELAAFELNVRVEYTRRDGYMSAQQHVHLHHA